MAEFFEGAFAAACLLGTYRLIVRASRPPAQPDRPTTSDDGWRPPPDGRRP